ncbi:18.2 kDa class I heat shock protein [Acorus calamus]|uniref:18.2 kDa class I heat shock protein n=1 Tax=Acorus calamus TaxID=4465 RepID=A0AAV9DDU2_ACOCL|nr:18.2 kDa class I heat shock protein [Acorus calamus]
MSLIPHFFGGRRNVFDPFSLDVFDPFDAFRSISESRLGSLSSETSALVDQVKAAMENGVLTVTVPKAEVKKPEVKAIDISG